MFITPSTASVYESVEKNIKLSGIDCYYKKQYFINIYIEFFFCSDILYKCNISLAFSDFSYSLANKRSNFYQTLRQFVRARS